MSASTILGRLESDVLQRVRLFSLVDVDGSVRFHWRTTEQRARRHAFRNGPAADDRLIDGGGRTIATGAELIADEHARLSAMPPTWTAPPLLVLAQAIACGSDLAGARMAQRYQYTQLLGIYRLRRRWAELFAATGEAYYAVWEAQRREGLRNFQRVNVSNARHWLVRQRAYEAGAPLLPMTRQPIGATS